jgi:PDZ domain-containing secreted protein
MLNSDISVESKDVINQQVLEEKFSAGLMEFEALIQSVNGDNKSKLVDLLAEFTEE